MAVDYRFLSNFSLTSIGNKGAVFYASPLGLTPDKSSIYGYVNNSKNLYRFDFSDESLNLLGTNSNITGTAIGSLAVDTVNGWIFVTNNSNNPGNVHKISLASPTSAPVATYTVTGAFTSIVGFSPSSNTLFLSGRQVVDASTMTLVATASATGAGLTYISSTNEFFAQDSLNTVRYFNASTGAQTKSHSNGVGGSVVSCTYSPDSDRIYSFLSSRRLAVYNPQTGTVESVSPAVLPGDISATAYIIYYVHKLKILIFLYPVGGTQIHYIFDASNTDYDLLTSLTTTLSNRGFSDQKEEPKIIILNINTTFNVLNLNTVQAKITPVNTFNAPTYLSASSPSDDIYFPSNNVAEINVSVNYYKLDAVLSIVASENSAILYDWVRGENSNATTSSTLSFTDLVEIVGNFVITITSGGTLRLGTRTEYTESIVFQSGSTIEVRNDVTLTGFTLVAGVAINRASGVTDPVTVTLLSDPGVVPGTGVTIAAPQELFVRAVTGLPVGAKVFLARRSAPGFALLSEFTLASGNNSGNNTLVIAESIPDDKPDEGYIRVFDNAGNEDRYQYVSWAGSTFTLSGTLSKNYAAGNSCYVPYLDTTAGSDTVSVELLHVTNRDVVLAVRLGSGTGAIEDIVQNYTLTNQDSSVPVSGVLDPINNL